MAWADELQCMYSLNALKHEQAMSWGRKMLTPAKQRRIMKATFFGLSQDTKSKAFRKSRHSVVRMVGL